MTVVPQAPVEDTSTGRQSRDAVRDVTSAEWCYGSSESDRALGVVTVSGTPVEGVDPPPSIAKLPGQRVERFNRTLQIDWAYRHVFTTNNRRAAALPDFLDDYNHRRRHHALGGHPPISRLQSPT